MTARARDGQLGLTLVEVLVALALFGLIALAGFTVLDGTVRTQERTAGRLDRLADLQRAMYLITLDLEQIAGGPILHEDDRLAFRRLGAEGLGGPVSVEYRLADAALHRSLISASGHMMTDQRLLGGVSALGWEFRGTGPDWRSDWPPEGVSETALPRAVAATLELSRDAGPAGELRRLVRLPAGLPP